jgi:TolA-binding protein
VAVLDSTLKDRLREQEKTIAAPVAGLSGKVDSFAEDLRYFKEALGEVDGKLGKLQLKLVDIENAIKVSGAPAVPPPGGGGAQGAPAGTPDTPPPGTTADSLYQDAYRDKNAGNYELALNELNSFLKWYSSTDLAPNAQFWIGDIYFTKRQFEDALAAFDAVLTRFGKNNKSLDARYMKGRTLVQLGRKTEAANEFREVIRAAPRGERTSSSACSALKELGFSCSVSTPAAPARGRKK